MATRPRPTQEEAHEAVRTLLAYLGENPDREGLLDTPKRVVKAWTEMTCGLDEDPREHLRKNFALDDGDEPVSAYDQVIVSGELPFVSNCEHHMMPFHGYAHVAYIPGAPDPGVHLGSIGRFPQLLRTPEPQQPRVVGLSKIARLVEGYARRLQVQERLTQQIADAMQDILNPQGVAVIIKAKHSCQRHRGIRKDGSMTTSALYGAFRKDASARAELMRLLHV